MPAAIQFVRAAYTTAGPKLMGRNAAGESFLRAMAEAAGDGPIWSLTETSGDADGFVAEVRRWSTTAVPRSFGVADHAQMRAIGTLFTGDPILAEDAWRRLPFGKRSWSLCGITHTTASHGAMDGITALVAAPVEPWDALICTSAAVKSNVERLIEAQREYLRARHGAVMFPAPQLPVIPLGVHALDFTATDADRRRARAALDLIDDAIVVLYVGRLSAHAKANPIACYLALERAAATTSRPIVLVEYGQFPNRGIEDAFSEAAAKLCPTIRRITLDGSDAALGKTAWASADIFCSLSDNVQEAFGITPVEAMAAGLPVVVSDWDGYRDTVREGVDGFRIPTAMPRAGLGQDIAVRHLLKLDSYDRYIGYTSALTAVDIDAAANAFARLFASDDLRVAMGASAQKRAREVYDWTVVLRQYEALWGELAETRLASPELPPALPPARQDPFELFAGYPTDAIDEQASFELVVADLDLTLTALGERASLKVIDFASAVISTPEEVRAMLERAADGPAPVHDLVASIIPERRALALRSLGWLLKLGIIRRVR